MDRTAHANALLSDGRCCRCAERVPRPRILRLGECGLCGAPLRWRGEGSLLEALEAHRGAWRIWGYGLIAVGSFVASNVPLLQLAVQISALFILHIVVLRRPLLWLSPGRRLAARVTIRLLEAAVACTAFLVNAAVAPILGLGAPVLAVVGPLLTAIYVEGGLKIVRQRLRWESQGRGLGLVEWGLPTGLAAILSLMVVATATLVFGTLHVLSLIDVPSIDGLVSWFLEFGR